MLPIDRPRHWVGRRQELATIAAAAGALRRGEGSVIWVEGEAGIGKSALIAEALAANCDPAWNIEWGIASRLTQRLPLRAIQDCLQVRPGSPDPRRARASGQLRGQRLGLFSDGDALATGVEVLVALADELCAAAPTVIVLDDVQWADDASLIVWHQLAASAGQLPLLLIATSRPSPGEDAVLELRGSLIRRGGALITLGPLARQDVTALVTALLGSAPADGLQRLAAQAGGNPLYICELVDALMRERALRPLASGEVSVSGQQLPPSLGAALSDRLGSVPAETAPLLRTAALLGPRFAVTDLAVVLRRPASELAGAIQDAVAAGILADSGAELTFRHPLIHQALYESIPAALRTALHAEAARELADTAADPLSVAQQLLAGDQPGARWSRQWLIQAGPALAAQAPQLAVDLLRRELEVTPGGHEAREGLIAGLVQALLAAGSYKEAADQAVWGLRVISTPARRAETYSVLCRAQVSAGDPDGAIRTLRAALASPDVPPEWRARMLAFQSMLERASTGDLEAADATARQALAAAEQSGDALATVHSLSDLWLSSSVRRDHAAALGHLDRALHVLGDDPLHADLRSFVLGSRVFTLQNLDQWPEAELALRQAREAALHSASQDIGTRVSAAVYRYWLGQWDDALAELSPGGQDEPGRWHSFLREHWPLPLVHGVRALIAVRRDQRALAGEHLRQGLALPLCTVADRENSDFLVAAHALALEQRDEVVRAAQVLAALLSRRPGEMTLTHQWLPVLVRLALAAGDRPLAQAAADACEAEAAAETRPARAATASLRCRGLLRADPVPLRDALARYRQAGPAGEVPGTLEDLAAVLAGRGRHEEARALLTEAAGLYEGLGAQGDLQRADSRLRPLGVRRGARGRREQRPASGWAALTPTELRVAALVAAGSSTSDIAASLFLSRRTVQTHVSHILAKLGARGRVEIVREALRQGVSA